MTSSNVCKRCMITLVCLCESTSSCFGYSTPGIGHGRAMICKRNEVISKKSARGKKACFMGTPNVRHAEGKGMLKVLKVRRRYAKVTPRVRRGYRELPNAHQTENEKDEPRRCDDGATKLRPGYNEGATSLRRASNERTTWVRRAYDENTMTVRSR